MSVPNLPSVCQKLWELDDNRLAPRRDYEVNLQARLVYKSKTWSTRMVPVMQLITPFPTCHPNTTA